MRVKGFIRKRVTRRIRDEIIRAQSFGQPVATGSDQGLKAWVHRGQMYIVGPEAGGQLRR